MNLALRSCTYAGSFHNLPNADTFAPFAWLVCSPFFWLLVSTLVLAFLLFCIFCFFVFFLSLLLIFNRDRCRNKTYNVTKKKTKKQQKCYERTNTRRQLKNATDSNKNGKGKKAKTKQQKKKRTILSTKFNEIYRLLTFDEYHGDGNYYYSQSMRR